jgi:hypothetical protein
MLLPRIVASEMFSFDSSDWPFVPNFLSALILYKFDIFEGCGQPEYLPGYQIYKKIFQALVLSLSSTNQS